MYMKFKDEKNSLPANFHLLDGNSYKQCLLLGLLAATAKLSRKYDDCFFLEQSAENFYNLFGNFTFLHETVKEAC